MLYTRAGYIAYWLHLQFKQLIENHLMTPFINILMLEFKAVVNCSVVKKLN